MVIVLQSIVRNLCYQTPKKIFLWLNVIRHFLKPKGPVGMWYLHVTLIEPITNLTVFENPLKTFSAWKLKTAKPEPSYPFIPLKFSWILFVWAHLKFAERIKSIFTHNTQWIYQHLDVCCWSTLKNTENIRSPENEESFSSSSEDTINENTENKWSSHKQCRIFLLAQL